MYIYHGLSQAYARMLKCALELLGAYFFIQYDALSFLRMHILRHMQNSAPVSYHVAYKK